MQYFSYSRILNTFLLRKGRLVCVRSFDACVILFLVFFTGTSYLVLRLLLFNVLNKTVPAVKKAMSFELLLLVLIYKETKNLYNPMAIASIFSSLSSRPK